MIFSALTVKSKSLFLFSITRMEPLLNQWGGFYFYYVFSSLQLLLLLSYDIFDILSSLEFHDPMPDIFELYHQKSVIIVFNLSQSWVTLQFIWLSYFEVSDSLSIFQSKFPVHACEYKFKMMPLSRFYLSFWRTIVLWCF